MAQGSIRKRQAADGPVRYDVTIDLGSDPLTGKRRQRRKTCKSKKEAQTALAAWLADIDRGTAVDRSRQMVAETVHYWLETYARPNLRPKTVQTYAEVIETHLVPGLGHIAVQGLTSVQVQAFYSRMLAEGIGPWTVRYCHQRLSQALKQAMRLGIVVRNVCEAVDPPRLPSHEMQTWDAAQARHFLDVAGESGYGPIWVLALATGMRRGELLGLRWGDVDLERGLVHIRQTVVRVDTGVAFSRTKSAAGHRSVRIQPAVVALLRAHRTQKEEERLTLGAAWQDHDLVFAAANGEPINPSNLRRDFLALIERADVPLIRVHDLRHTHVSLALASGAPLGPVSEAIGHAQKSLTLNVYSHILPAQQSDVANKISEVLFGEHDGSPPSS